MDDAFRKITAADLPPGCETLDSKEAILRHKSPEGRPRSLTDKFLASFFPDGQLECYAYFGDGPYEWSHRIELERGIAKATYEIGGCWGYYVDGRWRDYAHGHEEGSGTGAEQPWEEWAREQIRLIHSAGVNTRRTRKPPASGRTASAD